ncbi:hypothetical protein JTB14_014891 [Gonioctena quinquepunctata]|nr:hypothetical protein JTB14_014891 [Gonioctena quinquepunctata]
MSSELKIGDLVWAKMKGFSPWPSRIVQPGCNTPNSKKSLKKGQHWVYFFGSNNYGPIEENNIKPYAEYKEKFIPLCNTAAFKKAVAEIEDFLKKLEKDPNYQLELPSEQPSKSKDDSDEKFNRLVTPKRTKKAATVKRQNSDSGSSSKNSSFSKRGRQSSPRMEENGVGEGIGTVGTEILNCPSITDAPESPTVDLHNLSELLKTKDISASKLTFGFIGLGIIGTGIVKNLINSGHRVNLYSRTMKKKTITTLALQSRNLDSKYWETVLQDSLHSIRFLLCTSTNETSHERIFSYPCRTLNGSSLPSWLTSSGPVLMKKEVRASKYDPLVEEVELIESNEGYAHVRLPNGRETTPFVILPHIPNVVQQRTMDNMKINNQNTDNGDEHPPDYLRGFVTF